MTNKVFEIIIICFIFTIGMIPLTFGLEDTIENLFKKADELVKDENFDELFSLTEKILLEYPSDGDALYYQGIALKGLERYDEAGQAIIDSRYTWGYRGEHKEMLGYYQLGDILLLKGKYSDALKQFGKIKEDFSIYPDAKYKTGLAYIQLKNFSLAQTEFEEVIKINSNYHHAIHQLGFVLYLQGDNDNAIRNLEMVVNLKPDFYNAFETLGDVYYNNTQFEKAISIFQKIPPDFKNYDSILGKTGKSFWKLNSYSEAKTMFEEAIDLNPNNIEIQSYLDSLENDILILEIGIDRGKAIRFFEDEDYEPAIPLFEKVLEHDENNLELLTMLSISYYELEDYKKSERISEKIFKLDPENLDALNLIALNQMKQNKEISALDKIQLGLDIDSRNTLLLNTKASIEMQIENWDEASTTLKFILEIDPSNDIALVKKINVTAKLAEIETNRFMQLVGVTLLVSIVGVFVTFLAWLKPRRITQK